MADEPILDGGDQYRAVVNLDYTRPTTNDYQRILKALDGAGWDYVETSAMAYEGDLNGVRLALELLARCLQTAGTLSALTLQVQRIGPIRRTPGAARPENALRAVLRMDLPPRPN